MTGFGYCEKETDTFYAAAEIKSYNNRYLDLQVNLPPFLSPLEPRVREHVGKAVRRGRVEVYLRMRELEEDLTVHLDRKVASEYSRVLRELASIAGSGESPGIGHLLGLDGVLKSTRSRNIDSYWDAVLPLLDRAVAEFSESRVREGRSTHEDILKQLGSIDSSLALIHNREAELEGYFITTVRERFREVLGDEADEQRVLTEIAALLVKYTINEELVRLRGAFGELQKLHRFRRGRRKETGFSGPGDSPRDQHHWFKKRSVRYIERGRCHEGCPREDKGAAPECRIEELSRYPARAAAETRL